MEDTKQYLGEWYDSRPKQQWGDTYTQRAYNVVVRINRVWYRRTPIPVEWTQEDPYDSYEEMRESVERTGVLKVFSGGSKPDFMSKTDNIIGRAVHDYWGHLQRDCNFSMRGEWQKFDHVKDRYPQWVRPLLFTEIVGQRAAASYYDGGFTDDEFTQKSVFASGHVMQKARKAYE